ncbi:Transcriptional regulator [Carbonactinospora thermoautotrophica]|uniref:Transcriptional regulator n=1 Tax=Carbonactinospora thermoautotrophica TaxID=1469144 RepID=A0A132MVQ5_9ACTN|nr:helix-turn-helix transcriptional regulator [Carbonactinospora thermoautotrophica]KWX01894.1 Transcriptional regulator [Carbonactinospora thermoautotrophica]
MAHIEIDAADVGRRIQRRREQIGKSRATVAGLCGHGESWLKKIERGERWVSLPELYRLGAVLEVRDLSELTGGGIPSMITARPAHPDLPTVRDAMMSVDAVTADREPADVTDLRRQLDDAWRTWHTSPTQRSDAADLLPGLIVDMRHAARVYDGTERRRALTLLSETYHLAQAYLAWQSSPELLWMSTDRALTAAEQADDMLALASAVWYYAHAVRAVGEGERATEMVVTMAEQIEPRLERLDGPDFVEHLAMWGTLYLCAALTVARAGDSGDAWRYWDRADSAARRLPDGYAHPWHMFGRANVDLYGVSIAVELNHPEEALRRAQDIRLSSIPSRERRARHLIELARGYHRDGDQLGTVNMLKQSYEVSPEVLRYNVIGRAMLRDLVRKGRASVRDDVERLAEETGVLVDV